MDVVDGGPLAVAHMLGLLGTVILHGCRYHHTKDIDRRTECLLVFVGHTRVAAASLCASAKGHECPHLVAIAYNQDTGIGNLGRTIADVAIVKSLYQSVAFECIVLTFSHGISRGMEGDLFLRE